MTSKERMHTAMSLKVADRVPVMCQRHYFLHSGLRPIDIRHTTAEAILVSKTARMKAEQIAKTIEYIEISDNLKMI